MGVQEIMEHVVIEKDEQLIRSAVQTVHNMIAECPNPTQAELRKLLAVQGTILNQIGIEILVQNRGEKRNDKRMNLALRALAASREALGRAAGVDIGIDKDF